MMLRLCRLLAALWWGGLSALAFVAVPVIFATVGDKAVAGQIAARIFDAQSYWTLTLGLLLLLVERADPLCRARGLGRVLVFALLAVVVNHWLVSPLIVTARATGGNLALWHGVGSALIALQFAAGTWVNWRLSSRQSLFT
jgi:hypothetical protein